MFYPGARIIIQNIIFIIDSITYYVSILILSTKLLGAKGKPKIIAVSFSFYILSLVIVCCRDYIMSLGNIFTVIISYLSPYRIFMFLAANVLFARLCLRNIHIKTIVAVQLFIFSFNMFVVTFLWSFGMGTYNHSMRDYIELIENIILMICCILISCTGVSTKIIRILNCTSKAIKRLIVLLTICIAFVTSIVVYFLPYYTSSFNKKTALENIVKISFIFLIILILVIVLLLLSYSVSNKHIRSVADNLEKQIEIQSEHYMTLSKYNFELRRFRHDYKNMCIGVSALISEGKNDEALEMLKKNNPVFETDLIKYDTGNGIVDALLADKQRKADETNAEIRFEGALPANMIKPADLCIIFGNTIDNAIEACTKLDSAEERIITVKCACNSGFVFVDIINPVSKKVEIKGHIPKTSKADKTMHGFGLYSVEKALNQYEGQLNVECDDRQFHVSMELSVV